MKKLLFISALLFVSVFSTTVFAQSGKFILGANGGIGASKASVLLNYGLGYSGNISLRYNISEHFSIGSGLAFEQRNSLDEIHAFHSEDNVTYNFEIKHSFNFVQIPVLFRAEIGNNVKYFLNAGPYFSYLANQTQSVFDQDQGLTTVNNQSDSYKIFVAGVSVGLGASIPISDKTNISIELRSNNDLSNMSKIDGTTARTSSALFLFGVNYKLGE